mgnify:CR=1 FL=1
MKILEGITRFNEVAENRIKRANVKSIEKSYPQLLFVCILLSVKYWWEVKPIKSAARKQIDNPESTETEGKSKQCITQRTLKPSHNQDSSE